MLGRFLNLNKMKTKNFKSHEPIFYSQQNVDKCLNWEILQFYAQNELISNLMPATGFKIVGTGGMFTMV